MCRTHGRGGEFGTRLWSSAGRPPPLYPDAVTLVPETSGVETLKRIDLASPGGSVKDSFDCLDLSASGFVRLFDAQWIVLPPDPRPAATTTWSTVRTPAELAVWAAAWDGDRGHADLFRPELLAEPDVAILAARVDGRVVAGAVANRSATIVGAVGLSNVFAVAGSGHTPASAWTGARATVAHRWPGLPLVGYAHGDDLATAVAQGFTPVGPLTVWVRW
jgi:hypothetical protein